MLNCDNVKSFKGFYSLVMVRGKRRVFVGLFPHKYRASSIASQLDWDGFKPLITKI